MNQNIGKNNPVKEIQLLGGKYFSVICRCFTQNENCIIYFWVQLCSFLSHRFESVTGTTTDLLWTHIEANISNKHLSIDVNHSRK